MEAAVGAANWLLGKLLSKLSDGLVAGYVASLNLGHNFQEIRLKLLYTQGLLHAAQGSSRDVSHNPGLQGLLQELSKKADEAEDALDELHYFMIQDQLDGTNKVAVQDPGPGMGAALLAHARHGLHAALYPVGNWLSSTVNDDSAVASNPHNTTNSGSDNVGGHADKLSFNRVEMSMKIKSVIQEIHALCDPISNLLDKIPNNNTAAPLTRPQRGSAIVQDKLYGREAIFHKTAHDITNCGKTLSVLPLVGPGGIGKTTFAQHLYNDPRTKDRFTVRVWECVSTIFDVLELTKQILGCIPATEKEGSNTANETSNLSKLQESIAHRLKSKRFLIVLDDIWKCDSKEDWETLLAPFTKGETKGSMVLVTTRFPKLADMMKTIDPIELRGLESDDFFTFFEACIFGEHKKPGHYEDNLSSIAREIAHKLKGSPLAAKTVGRLLKKNISQERWNGVLEKHEWLYQQNSDDIMPSLKISYDYLPFNLQKCFTYCGLFPEDHRFNDLEINRFWTAIGIIDSSHQVDRNYYLEELVDNGFLMKGGDDYDQYYVMHDLMHELCRSVSAQECLNISDFDFRAEHIPPSVRHLSVTMEDRNDEKFVEEMAKLKRRIDIANLRTLMIFRGYNERITRILNDTFEEINGLRVLFIVVKSLGSLPHNFPKLIHLQYLKIGSSPVPYSGREMALPRTLSRFYHLKFLDLEGWCGSYSLPEDFSHLVNLRDFIAKEELHSNVPEVGKMKYLQELKQFCVKKERDGFEVRELGKLVELGGELSIHNLENVATKGEASDATLMLKSNLKKLKLVWAEPQSIDADVLDGLQPHPNLRALVIKSPGGTTGPSWLCRDIGVKNLETLHLEGVSWGTLPPFGQLPRLKELRLERISVLRQFGPDYGVVKGKCFLHLRKVILASIPELIEWVVKPNCHSFPRLESIECSNCPNLRVTPLSEYSCTNLCHVDIRNCPNLSLPPIPHTSTLRHFVVEEDYSETLAYRGDSLVVKSAYNGDLAFHNLDKVEKLSIAHISLTGLEKLKSLRELNVERCDSMFSEEVDGSVVFRSVASLRIRDPHLTEELLSKVFNCFPALSEFQIDSSCEDHEEEVIQFPSSSSLQRLHIKRRESLVLVPAEDGGGIQRDMSSLQSLHIRHCGKLFSRWPRTRKRPRKARGAQNVKPFPASLRELYIDGESSLQSMALLSNLTSLTELTLVNCDNLTMDGFNPLITVNLKDLMVYNYKGDRKLPHSIAADLLSEVARSITTMPAGSFQLERLVLDSISGVLVAPICRLLAATLHTLEFWFDNRTESLTEEQEKALQLLTSLQELQFYYCERLQSLPQGLHRLASLKDKLRCLPKDGFPTSLQKLNIWSCSAELKDQVEELKAMNPDSRVHYFNETRFGLARSKLLDSVAICT